MSRHGTLLPIPEGSELERDVNFAVQNWPLGYERDPFPRSVWLRRVEQRLLIAYPQSSSADRKLTARHYAPFPLRDGKDVP